MVASPTTSKVLALSLTAMKTSQISIVHVTFPITFDDVTCTSPPHEIARRYITTFSLDKSDILEQIFQLDPSCKKIY